MASPRRRVVVHSPEATHQVEVQRFEIPAGQRARIYRRYGNSLPDTIHFDAAANAGPVAGTIEVEGSRLRKQRPTTDLRERNVVQKSVWDSKFAIFVTPSTDVVLTLDKRVADGVPRLVWLLTGVVLLAVAAALIAIVLG